MKVHVVDYGVGNLHSILRALDAVGGEGVLCGSAAELSAADRVILPGVGAYGHCADELRNAGLADPVREFARSGRPLLGICVGMQLLFDEGFEFGRQEGLGLIGGVVMSIPSSDDAGQRKVPNIGWRALDRTQAGSDWDGTVLDGLIAGVSSAYFVHSYSCAPAADEDRLANVDYGGYSICAAVRRDNISGLQFHPERSSRVGLQIMANFLK